jgi:preprotein translocase subunit YajC
MEATSNMIIMLAVSFPLIYLMFIRPQAKQYKEFTAMIKALQKGDSIITNGGIHGKITKIEETFLEVEIADGVKIKIEKTSVNKKV